MILIDNEKQGKYNVDTYVDFEKRTNGLVLSVVIESHTDNNIWHQENVVSDKHIIRAAYSNYDLSRLGVDLTNVEGYISGRLKNDNTPYPFLNAFLSNSDCINELQVSLPVRHKGGFNSELECRPYINTFYPVSVFLNGNDISRYFESFDAYGYDIVDMVCGCLTGDQASQLSDDFYGNVDMIKEYSNHIKECENVVAGNILNNDENQR